MNYKEELQKATDLLAKEGYTNLTLHDLNSDFAEYRFEKYALPYKSYWDTNDKFDLILCFDVLEHLDEDDFDDTINLFKKISKENTEFLITATFKDDGLHPMHFEGNKEKIAKIKELMKNAE